MRGFIAPAAEGCCQTPIAQGQRNCGTSREKLAFQCDYIYLLTNQEVYLVNYSYSVMSRGNLVRELQVDCVVLFQLQPRFAARCELHINVMYGDTKRDMTHTRTWR